ncbi:MAG: hypothetical protein ACI4TK_11460 [Agathobacter sp.]
MEYKKDKRTKNLTLRDIHVGDWVQVWSDITERYSPPLKITQICDDGTIYLIIDEEHRLDPWEENIKDIDALPITPDLLIGFGFEKLRDNYFYMKSKTFIKAQDRQLDILDFCYINKFDEEDYLEDIAYMHELQQALHEERNFIGTFNPEWKGIEK